MADSAVIQKLPYAAMAELLATRLCHDVTGPIGAVSNGAEFLEDIDENEIVAQAVDLIKSSARQAVVRIQLFRLSYGVVKGDGAVDFDQIKSIASDYFEASKITLWWNISEGISMPRIWGKLLLNIMLASAELMPRGGVMKINCKSDDTNHSITVNASAERLKDCADIKNIITGTADHADMDTRNVQHYLLASIIAEIGGAVTFSGSDTECEISVSGAV